MPGLQAFSEMLSTMLPTLPLRVLTFNQVVPGSSPGALTRKISDFMLFSESIAYGKWPP